MAENKGATPPGGGRMNHDVMRRASEMPVQGAPGTDTLAASGGLELPGQVTQRDSDEQRADKADAQRVKPPTVSSVEKMDGTPRTEER